MCVCADTSLACTHKIQNVTKFNAVLSASQLSNDMSLTAEASVRHDWPQWLLIFCVIIMSKCANGSLVVIRLQLHRVPSPSLYAISLATTSRMFAIRTLTHVKMACVHR
jgi:hypothetical protein